MERSYLIRYGMMGQVGRFAADPGEVYGRGQAVVVRSHRGTEMGEVLIETPVGSAADVPPAGTARVLRAAGPGDVDRARLAGRERDERFAVCERVFGNGVWPIELIDVEALLDDRRTVLHYLGPHRLDVSGVLAAFREVCDLDVMLQPVGRDLPDEDVSAAESDPEPEHACGSCSSSGGGGCGSGGGCGDCGVKKLLDARR